LSIRPLEALPSNVALPLWQAVQADGAAHLTVG
jgi:hypothetical protein